MLKDPQRINKFITEAIKISEQDPAESLGFMARSLVICTLPHRKVEGCEYVRTNGAYTLTITAPSSKGIPYGSYPRLLLAWLTTQSVKTKSKEIPLGESLNGFMRELGITKSSYSVKQFRKQLDSLASCTISMSFIEQTAEATHEIDQGFRPIAQKDIWWSKKVSPEGQTCLLDSTITLSEEFYQEIMKSPIVFKMDALKVLRQSALAVDVYTWLTYRNSYAKKKSYISWLSLQKQFGATYAMTTRGKLDFKKDFIDALTKVGTVYAEAKKLIPETDHLIFIPGKPHVPKKVIPIKGS